MLRLCILLDIIVLIKQMIILIIKVLMILNQTVFADIFLVGTFSMRAFFVTFLAGLLILFIIERNN